MFTNLVPWNSRNAFFVLLETRSLSLSPSVVKTLGYFLGAFTFWYFSLFSLCYQNLLFVSMYLPFSVSMLLSSWRHISLWIIAHFDPLWPHLSLVTQDKESSISRYWGRVFEPFFSWGHNLIHNRGCLPVCFPYFWYWGKWSPSILCSRIGIIWFIWIKYHMNLKKEARRSYVIFILISCTEPRYLKKSEVW